MQRHYAIAWIYYMIKNVFLAGMDINIIRFNNSVFFLI